MEAWTPPFTAPRRLDQSINPGWVFGAVTINNANSRDPETEQKIVEKVSYGRQLGRIMDAVAVLVAIADPEAQNEEQKSATLKRDTAFEDFWEIRAAVENAKREAESRWLSEAGMVELAGKLVELRETDRVAYDRLARILRSALDR
jgi:hypothetical protein